MLRAIAPTATGGAGSFTSVTDSGLTAGRVTYAGVGGLLSDSANFTFVSGTGVVTVTGITSTTINGNTWTAGNGTLTLAAGGSLITAGAFPITLTVGATTGVTLPTTGTLATLAGAEAFTNKTYNGNTFTAGTGVLTIAAAKTLTASNSITLAGTDSTTMIFPPVSANIGYLNVPQNAQSAAYTAVAGDSGYSIDHPVGDNNARTMTIPSNASVAYALGTCISFSNMAAAAVTIAITADTLNLAGAGSTGSRTLAQYGVAVARKITSTGWLISGTNLT